MSERLLTRTHTHVYTRIFHVSLKTHTVGFTADSPFVVLGCAGAALSGRWPWKFSLVEKKAQRAVNAAPCLYKGEPQFSASLFFFRSYFLILGQTTIFKRSVRVLFADGMSSQTLCPKQSSSKCSEFALQYVLWKASNPDTMVSREVTMTLWSRAVSWPSVTCDLRNIKPHKAMKTCNALFLQQNTKHSFNRATNIESRMLKYANGDTWCL